MVHKWPLRGGVFGKAGGTGKATGLNAPEVERLLPPHYSIVYLLTKLTDDELEAAVKEGVINPDMKRADLQKWLRGCMCPRSTVRRLTTNKRSPIWRLLRAVLPRSESLRR